MELPSATLNLNLYRVFYFAAKTRSFSEVAKIMCISQPAISRHIGTLEGELKAKLFYRDNKGIKLTPEGEELFSFIEKSYNYLLLGEKQILELNSLNSGKISIGISSYLGINYLANYIENFTKKYPNIVIKIISGSSKELMDNLFNHSIDLIIDYSNNEDYSNINCNIKKIKNFKYSFFYNKYIFKKIDNDIKMLELHPLILPIRSSYLRNKIEDYFNDNEIKANIKMEIESFEIMMDYIKRGFGIGIAPNIFVDESLEKIDLENQNLLGNINLFYFDETIASATRKFINTLEF